jgi:hypothetical protein
VGLVLTLLLVILGPPLALVLLGRLFWKLSHLTGTTRQTRTKRLIGLAFLAVGLTGSIYFLVCVISARLPSAHAASSSAWPWGEEHPITAVLLASLAVTSVLASQPARRLAALSYGVGACIALSVLGTYWYLTDYPKEHLQQMRAEDTVYRQTGRHAAALDSFTRQLPRCHRATELDIRPPLFPGGDASLEQQLQALLSPTAPHPPVDSYVTVEFIVEPTGQITFPHVVSGLGPGYDEEAVRVVRHLPPFSPGLGRERQPVAVVWKVFVPFSH